MAVSSRRSFCLVLTTILVCGFLGVLFGQRVNSASTDDINESLRQFTSVYSLVEQNYAEPLKADKAIYNGAIPGMLRTLDPHSSFFDPKAYALLHEDQVGKYYGVGMSVGPRNNKIIVVAPFVGSPAYRAGLRPGDTLLAVDGKPTENMNTIEVADLLKGPRGTTVKVTVERQGMEHPLEFSMQRDEIPRYSVDVHEQIRPGIGYLHVDSFTETTGHEVQEALDQFGDIHGLILDLRANPGGLLNEAVEVSDKFLPKGAVIVSHHGRASAEHVYRATHGASGRNYPIVILVNRNTASAAEIVSGALQDHDRALIAGETTFGKGLVQTVYPLSNDTGLALTTAKYYTPSGRLIQRDYNGVSLYDYYYNREQEENSNAGKEVKLTDSGRTVYGGGGITPDIKIAPLKTTRFEDSLLQKYAFFNFAQRYLQGRTVDKNFEVTDAVLQEFRKFLDAQRISYTEADIKDGLDWIKSQIKSELFIAQFGQQEGLKVRAQTDPQVLSALNLLSKAKELSDNARHVLAQRTAAATQTNR